MGLLNRELLLQKEELEITKVDLGEDVFVYVRQMTGRERDVFEKSMIRENKKIKEGFEPAMEDFRAKLAVSTVCDESGKLLLSIKDYPTLSQNMSAARLEKIVNVAQKLNAISKEDQEALIKNSEVGQADNSISDFVES